MTQYLPKSRSSVLPSFHFRIIAEKISFRPSLTDSAEKDIFSSITLQVIIAEIRPLCSDPDKFCMEISCYLPIKTEHVLITTLKKTLSCVHHDPAGITLDAKKYLSLHERSDAVRYSVT
jgi:hypothetical protein